MDDLDLKILDRLQSNARLPNAELARAVNLSPPAVHARVKKLEQEGWIVRYEAVIDRERAGFDLMCFVQVGLGAHQTGLIQPVHDAISKMPEVLECHHVTGDFDFLLKVALRNRVGLHNFIVEKLVTVPGISRVSTSVVLKEIKSTSRLPLTT